MEGINLRGIFRFPTERYAEQLLPSQTVPKILATHEIDVAWARASASQNTEQERQRNQALNRPTPHRCSLPALRIWQLKQVDPMSGAIAG